MKKNNKSKVDKEKKNKNKILKWVLGFFGVLLIGLGFVSNAIPFTYNTIRCGRLPVQSTKFMAAYSYKLPGDYGYGIHFLSEYNFCTESEIKATGGYHRDVNTEAAKQESARLRAEKLERQKFSLSKLDYPIYIPDGYTINNLRVSRIEGNTHTFYKILRGDKTSISVRELKKDDSYNICSIGDDPDKKYCKVIGIDNQGREIKREFIKTRTNGWNSYYVGINIDQTGIILRIDDDQEAISILSNMKLYEE